jgi:excisionase family DNA binding protein
MGTVVPVTASDWYTSGDVARLLGVTDRTIVNWARGGLLPHHVTPGGHRRFLREDVERFIAERRRVPAGSHS